MHQMGSFRQSCRELAQPKGLQAESLCETKPMGQLSKCVCWADAETAVRPR
jgi:hypothetical protein